MLVLVQGLRAQMPRLGTRKLFKLLHGQFAEGQLKVGRDKLFTILRQRGLLVARRRRYTKTTDSRHWMHKFPNLIKDNRLEELGDNTLFVSANLPRQKPVGECHLQSQIVVFVLVHP